MRKGRKPPKKATNWDIEVPARTRDFTRKSWGMRNLPKELNSLFVATSKKSWLSKILNLFK